MNTEMNDHPVGLHREPWTMSYLRKEKSRNVGSSLPWLSRPTCTGSRLSFLHLATWLLSFGLLHAEPLTLQLPISRASHSFTLWELNGTTGTPQGAIDGWPNLGMPAGSYSTHSVVPYSLMGGSFNYEGVWIPGQSPFLQATVEIDSSTHTMSVRL